MAQKSDVIAANQFALYETQIFINNLSNAERSTTGRVDQWTARDMLAHLGDSVRQMNETLAAGVAGEAVPAGITNDEAYHLYKDRPWEAILALIQGAYASLAEHTESFSEEEMNARPEWLNGPPVWRAIASQGFLHPVIHLAQAYIERGERDQAIQLNERATAMAERLDQSPDWQGVFLYNTGCFYALMGEKELALDYLKRGFSLSPRLVEFSKQDTDLVSLQEDPEFLALYK